MLLSDELMLFVSAVLFVRALLFWKRGIQPKVMLCEAVLDCLAMFAIATGHWGLGMALLISCLLLEGVALFAAIKWQSNNAPLDE